MSEAAAVLLDVSVKLALAGALVWTATRRIGPEHASRAHLAWVSISAAFVVLSAVELVAAPSWLLVPRTSVGVPLVAVAAQRSSAAIALYLCVTAILLLRTAFDVWRVRRLERRSIPVDVSAGEGPASLTALRLHRIRVFETASLAAPATAGWWRTCVFLPAGWQDMDVVALDAALWHELAHVARRDYAVGVGARIIAALFWFHPVPWLAAGRLRWFAEVACDAAAARAVGTGTYSRALLAIGRDAAHAGPSLMLGASSQLPRRLALLIAPVDRARGRRALACAFAVLLVLPFTICVRTVAAAPSPWSAFGAAHELLHQQRHAALHRH